MKTADLIPFILLELNDGDKYGFELTKAIENKSNGKIVIKQPTLYTLLKKLEKSKFITSYWEDSEIGGKRHYYKLTQNGRLQVSTLPSYDFLLKNISSEESDVEESQETTSVDFEQQSQEQNKVSIMDKLISTENTPHETVLPTTDVFAENNLDTSTEIEINVANTDILREESISLDEQFATNESVTKFTEKVTTTTPSLNNTISQESTTNNSVLDIDFTLPKNEINIKYVDYIDFKNTDGYKNSKTIIQKMFWQVLSTSASLLVLTILCSIITSFTGRSGLYYFFFISSLLVTLFYPILFLINMDKIRLKYQNLQYNCKTKLKIYVGITSLLIVLIVCVISNIYMHNNTIGLILNIKNFANIYAPFLLTATYFLDILFNHLFCSKLNK